MLELKDRLGLPEPRHTLDIPGAVDGATTHALAFPLQRGWREQIHGALVGLGWTSREADEALVAVAPEVDEAAARGETPDVAALLRSALRTLGRT